MKVISYGNQLINDGENYVTELTAPAHTPAEVTPGLIGRSGAAPVLGSIEYPPRYLVLRTYIPLPSVADKRALQNAWYMLFRTDTARNLVISDDDGGNARYVMAVTVAVVHTADGDGWEWDTMLAVDGDKDWQYAWRRTTADSVSWNITVSGATKTITNGVEGVNLDAYPIITVTPNQAGGGSSNNYSRFVILKWRAALAASNYPVNITAGGLDTRIASTNFYDADGDDIRVYIDGTDTDYWLVGANSATTSIWCNLSFQAKQTCSLSAAVDDGALTTLTSSTDITNFPNEGIILIGSELFTYTGKSGLSFTGVTRAQYGTTAASHNAAATIEWIQHEILIEYGNDETAAKTVDDAYKPIFKLSTSTNTSWVYEEFFEEGKSRAGAWQYVSYAYATAYGGNRDSAASLYVEAGSRAASPPNWKIAKAQWQLMNVCGITAANFTNGEAFPVMRNSTWKCYVRSSLNGSTWTNLYTIPPPSNSTWGSWSYNASSLAAGTAYVAVYHEDSTGDGHVTRLEFADCTVTLHSDYTPAITIGGEISSSRVVAVLANTTTGEEIEINFSTSFEADDSIEINADRYTVVMLKTHASQLSAVRLNAMRRHMLRLVPGDNILKYTDENLTDVDVEVVFEKRYLT